MSDESGKKHLLYQSRRACADVPEMPGNLTLKEVSASTVLLSADIPQMKPISEHGGLDVISWVVTYQAESIDGAPIGREFTATFYNGTNVQLLIRLKKILYSCTCSKLYNVL